MTTVALTFTLPESGWMPTRLRLGDMTLNFDVSDVPNNVVEELYDAIAATAAGREGGVWWHEEPAGHWMELSAIDGGEVRLRLWYRESEGDRPGREIADMRGSRDDILLPLWRGLRQFITFPPDEQDWTAPLYDDFPARVMQLREAIAPRG